MEILIGILLLIIALLLIKVSVIIKVNNDNTAVYLSVLFLRFKLYPQKEKKVNEKKSKINKAREQSESTEEKKKKKTSFSDIRKLLKVLTDAIKKIVPAFFAAIRLDRCIIKATIVGSDAADTAIKFGQLNAAVSSLYALLLNFNGAKNINISLNCDFHMPKSSYYTDIKISIRVFRAVLVAIKAGIALLPMLNKKENVYD